MKLLSRWITALGLGVSALAITSQAQAQGYPNRPVKLIVPLTPGSGADIAARIVGKALSEAWKQPVVIENRPGAGGSIGTAQVAASVADGYTLLVQSASYAANPAIYKKLPYDPVKGLIDVAILGVSPYVIVTAPNGPYSSIKELVAAAKAKPGEVPFASAGLGSSTHLSAEYFNQTAGVQLSHIPYKGSVEAIQDTMAGRTAFYVAPLETAIGHFRGGKLRALGMTGAARSETAPEIATVAEQGYPGFDIGLWFGVWAPAGTPMEVVRKLNADIASAMQDPEVKAAYARGGTKARPMSPEDFSAFVREEMSKYQKIAREARIEPQ